MKPLLLSFFAWTQVPRGPGNAPRCPGLQSLKGGRPVGRAFPNVTSRTKEGKADA